MSEKTINSPFHRGERDVQTRLGVRDKIEETGQRFIRSYLPDQHREFYEQLPYLFVGSIDQEGQPWASVLVGRSGFIKAPDEHTLKIATTRIDGDPLNDNLSPGSPVGVLGIQYEARRRNRLTGWVAKLDSETVTLTVEQTFGNCPQYIQAREPTLLPGVDNVGESKPKNTLSSLNSRAKEIVANADNFYIATHYADETDDVSRGADVSHRGGKPGFVRIDDDRTLTFPDFTGNFHFNTMGNIVMNPRAGLLFIDFESGDLLFLTCNAEIIWDSDEKRAFEGAERLVRITVQEGVLVEKALPIQWRFVDYSPSLDRTGTWDQTAAVLASRQASNTFKNYAVIRVERESEVISSFYLKPEGTESIHCHKAGEFLPIEIDVPGEDEPLNRTYTISNAPNDSFYRLTIKREPSAGPDLPPGRSSNFFHDHVKPGSTIRALAPRGQFVLEEISVRPVVLLSGGVGITPMISMLEQLSEERGSCGSSRSVWFIHATRSGKEHAFGDYVRRVEKDWPCLTTHFVYDSPGPDDVKGSDYDDAGRVDMALLKKLLPLDDYDFYFCGPPPFMVAIYEGLKTLNIPDERIHYEFFGPGTSLLRESPDANVGLVGDLENRDSVKVRFAASGKEAIWEPAKGTLLDLAEREGLRPEYSCRSGICGTCTTLVHTGSVVYLEPPLAKLAADTALICCSYPSNASASADGLVLDL